MERSEVFGVSKEDTIEYVNHQKKLREAVTSLTLNGALNIGLDKREFFRLKKKVKSDKSIVLRKKILKILYNFI